MVYSKRWPLIDTTAGNFYLKYGKDFSTTELRSDTDLAFNPVISFRVAQLLGLESHNEASFHLEFGKLHSKEQHIGDTLDKAPFEYSVFKTPFSVHGDSFGIYKKLLKKADPEFIRDDIYRLFSLMGDSEYPHNIAFDGTRIRWIDFGCAFSSESFGYGFSDVANYSNQRKKVWASQDRGLLQDIKDISSSQIEEIVKKVVFEESLTEAISDAPILTTQGLTQDQYASNFVKNILARRNGFREFE
jgi:hypothetical protein